MNTTFTNDELGSFRVIKDEQAKSWVCAKDVCDSIGLTNATLVTQVRIANGLMSPTDKAMMGDKTPMLYINETGLRAVATTTRKKHRDKAMKVLQWLMENVFDSEQIADERNDAPQQEVFDFEEVPTEELATQSNIQTFEHPQFGAIRTVTDENGETLWNASDVCTMLGYENAPKAIKDHVYFSDITKRYTTKSLGGRLMLYVNESGLNSLILGSKLPQAQEVKHWITSVVMVSIRKHGMYLAETMQINSAFLRSLADTWEQKDQMVAQVQQQLSVATQFIEDSKEKVRFADAFQYSKDDSDMKIMARMLAQENILWKGKKIGSGCLFKWMRRHKQTMYESHNGKNYNVPEQEPIDHGYLTTRMVPLEQFDDQLVPKTYVTAKGRLYYLDLFRHLKGDNESYDAYYEFDENGKEIVDIKVLLEKKQSPKN